MMRVISSTSTASQFVRLPNEIPGSSVLGAFITLGSYLGYVPYGWNWSVKELKLKSGLFASGLPRIWLLILWAYQTFLMFRCYQALENERIPVMLKVLVPYVTVMCGFLITGFTLSFMSNGSHQYVINQLLSHKEYIKQTYGLEETSSATLKWTLRVIVGNCIFGTTLHSLPALKHPQRANLLSSLLTSPETLCLGQRTLLFALHEIMFGSIFFVAYFNFQMLAIYIHYVTWIIRNLRFAPKSRNMSKDQVRKEYMTLLVLQSAFESTFSPWVVCSAVLLIFAITMNIFMTVVFRKVGSLIVSCIISLVLWTLTKRAGRVHEEAAETRLSWIKFGRYSRGGARESWFPKFVRATKLVSLPLTSAFFFDRGLMLTFMDVILSNAVTLIVTYREE